MNIWKLWRDNCENLRDLAMIDLLASIGMRGELEQLNRSDIDFGKQRGVLFLEKGKRRDQCILMLVQKFHLRNYLNNRKDESSCSL